MDSPCAPPVGPSVWRAEAWKESVHRYVLKYDYDGACMYICILKTHKHVLGMNGEFVTVEELAMQAMYRGDELEEGGDVGEAAEDAGTVGALRALWRSGGWEGWHCEGALIRSLFGILMWEELFMTPPPSENPDDHGPIFLTPYQEAPLDIEIAGLFYMRRLDLLPWAHEVN